MEPLLKRRSHRQAPRDRPQVPCIDALKQVFRQDFQTERQREREREAETEGERERARQRQRESERDDTETERERTATHYWPVTTGQLKL